MDQKCDKLINTSGKKKKEKEKKKKETNRIFLVLREIRKCFMRLVDSGLKELQRL